MACPGLGEPSVLSIDVPSLRGVDIGGVPGESFVLLCCFVAVVVVVVAAAVLLRRRLENLNSRFAGGILLESIEIIRVCKTN